MTKPVNYDDRLEFIRALQKFGANELGLKFDGSFQKLSEDNFSCNWVYSCYPYKLESTFIYQDPFEFYDDTAKALSRQEDLKQQGYETYFYHAEAHGGQGCPITKEMLEASRARQSYVILHEAWHSTCRLEKLNLNYSWEESSGRAIGLFAGIEYAKFTGDDELLKECVDQEKAWDMFTMFINSSWSCMQELYKSNPSQEKKRACRAQLHKKAALISAKLPESWEKQEMQKPINNAFVLRYHDYTVFYDLAKKIVLDEGSVVVAIQVFQEKSFKEIHNKI